MVERLGPTYLSGEGRGSAGSLATGGGLFWPLLGECGEGRGMLFSLDHIGIEGAAVPFRDFGVALVLRVGDHFEEVGYTARNRRRLRVDSVPWLRSGAGMQTPAPLWLCARP